MSRPQLSPRVQQIFEFISSYAAEHGYPPSVREIGSSVGLKSPSTVHMHLQTLEQKGFIKRTANKSRTIELVNTDGKTAANAAVTTTSATVAAVTANATVAGSSPAVLKGGQSSSSSHRNGSLIAIEQDLTRNTLQLPLVGRVAAGQPILAEENIEEMITVPTSLVGDACSFILRVHGDSMINAGIFDGDYIAVEQTPVAHNGEIVVALLDEGATVKTFYKEETHIRLQPENDSMEPIYATDVRIIGRVRALIRQF